MRVTFTGTESEIMALCARVGAIAATGERPAVEAKGYDISKQFRDVQRAMEDVCSRFDGSANIGPAQSGFMADTAKSIEEIAERNIKEIWGIDNKPTIPRKLSGFDEACEVVEAGRWVNWGNDSDTEQSVIDGWAYSQRDGRELSVNGGTELHEHHASFRDIEISVGTTGKVWFEVADPTAKEGEK